MKTIGKYQLFAEIYKGPITTLYKAYHAQLDRVVLIKQLNSERIGDNDLCDRFQHEGLIIANLLTFCSANSIEVSVAKPDTLSDLYAEYLYLL